MVRLVDLPVELLAQVLDDTLWPAALHLWVSGDVLLLSKMANRGIKKVILEDPWMLRPVKWPKCLADWKLVELRFNLPSQSVTYNGSMKDELKKLHSGIKRLEIGHIDATEGIFGLPTKQSQQTSLYDTADDGGLHSPPSKRTKLVEGFSGDSTDSDPWKLGDTFDQLEHLHISSHSNSRSSSSKTMCEILSLLPHTLTFLGLECREITDFKSFEGVPPALKVFKLPHRSVNKSMLRLLPKQIVDFGKGCFVDDAVWALVKDPSILPNLIDFPWDGITGATDWYAIDGNCQVKIKSWPYNLKSLSASEEPQLVLEIGLPRQLLCLSYYSIDPESFLCSSTIATLLPSGLTELKVDDFDWTDIDPSIWPSSLTSLQLYDVHTFGSQHFHRLPRRLKLLEASTFSDQTPMYELEGPSIDATSLRAIGRLTLLEKDSEQWERIKPGLNLATNAREGAIGPWKSVSSYIQEVEEGGLLGLPLSLTSLQLSHLQEIPSLVMPPQVITIDVAAELGFPTTEKFSKLLPPSVYSLTIRE